MKTKILLLLTTLATACSPAAFDLTQGDAVAEQREAYADCKASLYQPKQRIISGQMSCPNPCLYTHEGFINFKEKVLELNCRRYPLHTPHLSACIDSTRVTLQDGTPQKVILIVTPNYAAWCKDEAFKFIQAETYAQPKFTTFLEEGDPSSGSVGYLIFEMSDQFWRDFDPGKPFFFRFTGKKPVIVAGNLVLPN